MTAERLAPVIASFHGEYRFLSNFWPSTIVYDGAVCASVEHAYQAAKCVDPAEKEMIRLASTPGRAKRLSRRVVLRTDWESVKVGVMRECVRLKFRTHADLAALLLATGDAFLMEGNGWGDRFWGVCGGEGANWLGRILMEVRAELAAERTTGDASPTVAGNGEGADAPDQARSASSIAAM